MGHSPGLSLLCRVYTNPLLGPGLSPFFGCYHWTGRQGLLLGVGNTNLAFPAQPSKAKLSLDSKAKTTEQRIKKKKRIRPINH
jgi:hypothetical protein